MTRKYTLSDDAYLKYLANSNTKKLSRKDCRQSAWRETYNIVVLGAAKVGKSSIIERLVKKSIAEQYVPTVAEVYETRIGMSGKRKKDDDVKLRIYDTCGSQSFPLETGLTIDHGDAFVVVYAVDSEKSLSDAERLILDVKQRHPKRVSKPCVLVGNKKDVELKCRQVTTEQGLQVAVRNRSSFIETSARGGEDDMEELFRSLVKKVECQGYLQLLRQNDNKLIKNLHRQSTMSNLFSSWSPASSMQRINSL